MKKRIITLLLAVAMLVGSVLTTGIYAAEDTTYGDVDADRWSAADIAYVTEKGIMKGTGGGNFEPETVLNRAMVVTVLYRLAGEPGIVSNSRFADVADREMWYYNAVVWGSSKSIVMGFEDATFRPLDPVTREQLVTFIGRYAEMNYVKMTEADLSVYADADKIQSFSELYFKWAVDAGLVKGVTADEIRPSAGATREQFAAIMHRYNTLDLEYELLYNAPKLISQHTEEEYPLQDDADLFVSPDGDDSNPGTKAKPLATMEGARAAVRELKKTKTGDIKVAFMAGTYKDTNAVFTSDDSGNGGTVTYCAYGNGEVNFNNAYVFTTEDMTEISEADGTYFIDRFENEIKKIDVSDVLTAEEVESALLFNDGEMNFTARYPNRNMSKDEDTYISNGCTIGGKNQLVMDERNKTRLDGYHTYENVFVYGFYYWDYFREMGKIESYDTETGTVTLSGIHGVSNYWPTREFVIVNASEELDRAGEYWIDADTRSLYVFAPEGEYELAYNKEEIIKVEEGTDGITFKKLNFSCTTGECYYRDTESPATTINGVKDSPSYVYSDALPSLRDSSAIYTMQGCSNITFDGCEVSKIGNNYALFLDGYNVKFINGEIHELAGGGIFSYCGDEYYHNNLISAGKVIDNNLIYDNGRKYLCYHQGIYTCDVGAVISHNEIYNVVHNAIQPIGVETVIEYNNIYNCNIIGDAAAIYSGHSYTRVGNIIRYNLFKDNAGGFHIYLDDGLSGIQVYGNLFYNSKNVEATPIRMSGGRENSIYDNVMVLNGQLSFDKIMHIWAKFHDKLYWAIEEGETVTYSGTWLGWRHHDRRPTTPEGETVWAEKYPWLAATDFDYENWETKWQDPTFFTVPYNDTIRDNYAFVPDAASGIAKYSFDDAEGVIERYGDVQNNVVLDVEQNPLFVDPTHGNYSIRDDVDENAVTKVPYVPFEEMGRY